MLKIKDNVDLKELKKFGFFLDYIVDEHVYRKVSRMKRGKMKFECEWIIWEDRGIDMYSRDGFLDDTLYDLIQAGLAEKAK